MLTVYQRTVKQPELKETDMVSPGVWVHAENPTTEELARIAEETSLEEDTLRDALDYFEVPRFEAEREGAYFFTRFPHKTQEELMTTPILIAVSDKAVVTISRVTPPFMEKFISGRTDFFTTQKTRLFLLLLSEIIALYNRHLRDMRRSVRENRVRLREIRNRDIVELVAIETALNDFVSALIPTNAGLAEVLRGKCTHLPLHERDEDLMEDLVLALEQMVSSAQTNLKTIQNIRGAYATILSGSLNQTMKFLAALTIILTIPTIVSSFFGMNVPVPFANEPFGFFWLLALTALAVFAVVFFFSRRDWI